MRRALAALIAALMLATTPVACLSEGLSADIDERPDEVGEFDLAAPEPEPESTPEPTPEQTPLPTLEPGSQNYSPRKTNFEGEIWTILTKRWGLADYQAAGLMSSLYAESSFCPYNVQNKDGVDNRGKYNYRVGDSVGFGLCQWTSPGRKAALRRYAIAHGDANLVWDFDIQMGYMKGEINFGALKATQTLYEATEWAVLSFERPSQDHPNSWPGSRYDIARQIFKARVGKPYEEPPLRFRLSTPSGGEPGGVIAIDDEFTLIVDSNYYWRLNGLPAWLDAQRRSLDGPDEWEPRACGYSGRTALRLSVAHIPPLRRAKVRIEIYRGGHTVQTLSLSYTGPSVQEAIAARIEAWTAAMDSQGG